MHVPEAAVHEEHGAHARKDEVRLTGEIFAVKAVAESGRMQQLAHPHFRFGVDARIRDML